MQCLILILSTLMMVPVAMANANDTDTEFARLASDKPEERAVAVKALAQVGKPAVPALVKTLEDVRNDLRASAAEVLRLILTADPTSAPNFHDKTYWETELAKLNVGMRLEEAIKLLLPNATPAEREKALQGGAWSGQTGFSLLRLDDYWTVTFYLTDAGHEKLVQPPALNQSVRSIWVAPPANHSGPWVTWFVNGQKANENQYRNGQYDGTFTAFHDNGSKSYEQHYANGTCHGSDNGWYRSGKKMYVGQYKNGKQDGLWQHWYENGNPQTVRDYRDGEFSGIYAMWYENGQKQFEQHYRNGKLDGLDMSWDQNGKLQWMRMHRNGELIESK